MTMSLPPAEALEVFSAELAGDVLEIFIDRLDTPRYSLNIRCHVLHFVICEVLPILGVVITLFAVEVLRVVLLVELHGL